MAISSVTSNRDSIAPSGLVRRFCHCLGISTFSWLSALGATFTTDCYGSPSFEICRSRGVSPCPRAAWVGITADGDNKLTV